MKYLILISSFLFAGCCHQGEYHITVYNNSDKDLYCRTFIDTTNNSFNEYLKKINHQTLVLELEKKILKRWTNILQKKL